MNDLSWTLLSEEKLRLRYREILLRTYRYPDGSEELYEIFNEGEFVTILCLTPENKVILVRQFRPGPGRVLDEIPGGNLDTGETPMQAAQRELLEETGCTGDLVYIGSSLCEGRSTGRRHNFVATNVRPAGAQKLDRGEFIQVIEVSLDEFRAHLRSGNLTDVETGYLCLDYLGKL